MSAAGFEFATAGRIVFGSGAAAFTVPAAARELGGGARVMLVTGSRPERWEPFRIALDAAVFPVSGGEPTVDLAREGASFACAERAAVIVAIGGGSAIDAGKAIAALAANSGEPFDYLEVIGEGRPLSRHPLPFIAVPTTSGTGSEVTRNAVLGSPEHGVKASLRSPWMLPSVAVVDPELTREVPREIAAYTALDALTQLIEPLVSNRANAMSDLIAREGLALAAASLRTLECEGMARASLHGGMALANAGLGAVHGFAAAIGGLFPATPHGAICAAILVPVMRINIAALRARQGSLARYVQVAALVTGNPHATPEDGIAWVRDTVAALEAKPLRAYGVDAARVPEIIAASKRASSMKANPIELQDAELEAALIEAL